MRFLSALLVAIVALPSFAAQGQNNQRYNDIFIRTELLQKSHRQIYDDLTDINRKEAMRAWYRELLKNRGAQAVFRGTMENTKELLPAKDYRELLFYYTVTGQIVQAKQLMGLYAISAHTLLDNFAQNSQSKLWNPQLAAEVQALVNNVSVIRLRDVEKCYGKSNQNVKREYNLGNYKGMLRGVNSCMKKDSTLGKLVAKVKKLFVDQKYYGAPFPVSFMGHIGGNTVKLHNHIPLSPEIVKNLGEQLNKVEFGINPINNKKYSDMTVEDFKALMTTPEAAVNDIFSRYKEDFQELLHPSLDPKGMFGKVLGAIESAEESVMVDIFWMGGSIGMNLAKALMRKTIKNPDFQVYIISDGENKFAYGNQLDIITRYMQAYAEKFTDKNFYFAPANLNLKRTALPEFMDLLFTNNVVGDAQNNSTLRPYLEKDGFHLLAKSDHTKTVVVDGKNPELGKAFVGSKNWTDASGGVAVDEIAEIQGPAVAVILNAFYYDVLKAYVKEYEDGGSMAKGHIAAKVTNSSLSYHDAIQQLLAGMDVMDRYKNRPLGQTRVPYVEKGNSVVAPGQNNVNGTEMSPVEQNIQAILGAKKQILIDDQFLWDPSVIEALKVAKLQNGVDIYVMLNPMTSVDAESKVAAHIPNNLFVPELAELGIQTKWTKVKQDIVDALKDDKNARSELLNKEREANGEVITDENKSVGTLLSPEFHIKSLSVDGVLPGDHGSCEGTTQLAGEGQPIVVSGSANKDVLTMSGGFREFQVVVYDDNAAIQHDCLFWDRWNNPELTSEVTDGLDFEIPQQGVDMGITDQKEFLNALRMIFFAPYNFTKDFFNN